MQPSLFTATKFDGPGLTVQDCERLETQLEKVKRLMLTGRWYTLPEIHRYAGGSEAACSSRVRDLRKPKNGGYVIESRKRTQGLWEYRLIK
jgi:hypothetical protein